MAITTEWTVPNTSRKGYSGLSSDNKGDITDAVAGAEFHETDTNDLYIYDGAGWNLVRNNGYTLVESQAEYVEGTGDPAGDTVVVVGGHDSDNSLARAVRVYDDGAMHTYGLARKFVRQAAGTYNATEVFGFLVEAQPTADDTAFTGHAGSAVTAINKEAFVEGVVYPFHLTTITVGTGGEFILFLSD